MELRNLRAFVEVIQRHGFSAAAKALGLTQPTISKAIQQLEHDCGGPLLARPSRRPQLTPAGEAVYRRAITMLAEQGRLENDLAELSGLKRGRLRLGLPSLGSGLFAPLVATFRRRYPEIEIELYEQGSELLQERVRTGEIEIGSSLGPVGGEFEWQLVREEPLVAVLPAGHALERRKAIRLMELAATPFILFERGFLLNSVVRNACKERGFTPQEAARSGQVDFILALVAAGLGVAVLPRLIVTERGASMNVTVPIEDKDLRWRLGLIWQRGATLSAPARRWLDLVKEEHPPGKNVRSRNGGVPA